MPPQPPSCYVDVKVEFSSYGSNSAWTGYRVHDFDFSSSASSYKDRLSLGLAGNNPTTWVNSTSISIIEGTTGTMYMISFAQNGTCTGCVSYPISGAKLNPATFKTLQKASQKARFVENDNVDKSKSESNEAALEDDFDWNRMSMAANLPTLTMLLDQYNYAYSSTSTKSYYDSASASYEGSTSGISTTFDPHSSKSCSSMTYEGTAAFNNIQCNSWSMRCHIGTTMTVATYYCDVSTGYLAGVVSSGYALAYGPSAPSSSSSTVSNSKSSPPSFSTSTSGMPDYTQTYYFSAYEVGPVSNGWFNVPSCCN